MLENLIKLAKNYQNNYFAEKTLKRNSRNRLTQPIFIEEIFASKPATNRIILLTERDDLYGRSFFLNALGAEIHREMPSSLKGDEIAICFGYNALLRHSKNIYKSKIDKIFFVEAGFLRSVLLDNSSSIYDQAICFFVDDLGFHFDATVSTRIEAALNDREFVVSPSDILRAAALRKQIVDHNLTKYNDQDLSSSLEKQSRPRVLVVEQAKNDWAVLKSGGSSRSFSKMLHAAIAQNPDAEILVKVHPDTLDGKRGGARRSYYGRLQDDDRIKIIRDKVNPYTLLGEVEKVYVFSSMLGFEAALMGKEVHVFGKPCYAGWGLTIDYQEFSRRSRTRTLDEIVFII